MKDEKFVYCLNEIFDESSRGIYAIYPTFEAARKAFIDTVIEPETIAEAVYAFEDNFILLDDDENRLDWRDYDKDTLVKWVGSRGFKEEYKIFSIDEIVCDEEYGGVEIIRVPMSTVLDI